MNNLVVSQRFLLDPCRMFSQRLIVMLMLMMAIMPVAMASAYYSDISNQLASGHPVIAVDLADDYSNSAMPHDDHCQPNKPHPAGCSFHVCVDCAIASSFEFVLALTTSPYIYPEKPGSISIIAPLDIKPPIALL